MTNLILDLEVKFSIRGPIPSWLGWESDSVLVGTPPAGTDEEGYRVPINLTASYNAFGMSHFIESQLVLDVLSPGSGTGDLASSLRSISNVQSASFGPGMEGGMESYLDDDDDDMGYVASQNPFSSETNTPPSATMANPNQLLYVPSQSLQNSPLKHSSLGPTTPPSGPSHSSISMNPLTPTLSPASLQYNQHIVGTTHRQPKSAPQTPRAGPPSQLSLQIPHQSHDFNQESDLHLMNEVQHQVTYGLQNHMRLSPPASAESTVGGRVYGIDEELGDNNSTGHVYFDDSYHLGLGSPFLER